jgi:hypothetical protein
VLHCVSAQIVAVAAYQAAEVAPMSNIKSYPFMTKSTIKSRLAGDDQFVLQCLAVMLGRQTEQEQENKNTVVRNRQGFMSSHAAKGTTLAVKAAGEGLTEEETETARVLVSRYTKQLAAHFRAEAIAQDPGLAEAARVFSAS